MINKNQLNQIVSDLKVPNSLGFGILMAPVMFKARYENGQWGIGSLIPYGPLQIDPAAKVLQYTQEVFEGMKAYWVDSESHL